jgi:hypothetical protein
MRDKRGNCLQEPGLCSPCIRRTLGPRLDFLQRPENGLGDADTCQTMHFGSMLRSGDLGLGPLLQSASNGCIVDLVLTWRELRICILLVVFDELPK